MTSTPLPISPGSSSPDPVSPRAVAPRAVSPHHLLFVCSGNTCRSPFAAALVRHHLQTAGHGHIQVQSAGTAADPDLPMAVGMELILQERGIDSHHRSQRLTWDLLSWADTVLTMTRNQKILLLAQVPQMAPKLATLKEYAGMDPAAAAHGTLDSDPDIADPYGCDLASYRHCARTIDMACDGLLRRLTTAQP